MGQREYSASAVKLSFWFAEFRKVVSLRRSGITMDEIKGLAVDDNIFCAATPVRRTQIFNTVSARVSALPVTYFDIFENSGLETQKLINLTAIMETDALFCDFMDEIFREKLIIGDMMLTDADVRVFFSAKRRENEKAAKWTDGTFDRLRNSYKMYLLETGLLTHGKGERKIIKPLLENSLAALLESIGKGRILNILMGTR